MPAFPQTLEGRNPVHNVIAGSTRNPLILSHFLGDCGSKPAMTENDPWLGKTPALFPGALPRAMDEWPPALLDTQTKSGESGVAPCQTYQKLDVSTPDFYHDLFNTYKK